MTETTTARTWTLELPAGTPILTANHRMNRYAANRVTQELKDAAITLARDAKLPRIMRANIAVTYQPPPRRKADRHPFASERIEDSENLHPTGKALIDGLVKAKVLPNDSRAYVPRVEYQVLPQTHPRGLVRIHLTEVPG